MTDSSGTAEELEQPSRSESIDPEVTTDESTESLGSDRVGLELEEPIQDSTFNDCIHYWADYENAAKLAEREGDEKKSRTYRMLAALCSFETHFWNRAEPFGQIRISEELANISVEHLPEDWYPEIKKIAAQIEDSALKARLLDIHWLGIKDPSSCREAVTAYIESAKRLDHTKDWNLSVDHFHRACQLGNFLGLKNQSARTARSALDTAIKETEEGDENSRFSRLLQVGWDCGVDDTAQYAELAAARGQLCYDEGDLEAAGDIWKLESQFRRELKEPEASRAAKIRAAMTIVERARKLGVPGNFFAASNIMQKGITALRRAGEASEKIVRFKKELLAMQPEAMKEMHSFEHETDITEEVAKVRRSFDGLSLSEAIQKLCFAQPLVQVEELKKQTEREANQSLRQLFDGTLHADDGRVIGNQRGLIGLEGDEREKALEQEMFTSLHRFFWNCRSSCFIDPARRKIGELHRLHKADLLYLVFENPFIPVGHEEIFLRGIHAGFHGDFLTAALFLVPQIENSIRYVLKNNGVDISNLKDDQTQPVKLLGPLFDLPEMKETFGESYWFELRGLLIEKPGPEIRNRVAHGFISNPECYGPAAQNIWWIVLRLCMTTILAGQNENCGTGGSANEELSES